MSKYILSMLLAVTCLAVNAQSSHDFLRDGDAFYDQGDFAIAEEKYKKASEDKRTVKSEFNLGNSLYQLNRYEEAATQFERSTIIASSDTQKADAHYNMANTLLQEQNLDGAIEQYKNAIKLNPADMDARRNLYLAKLMQKQQQEQEQQQQQQQQEQQQEEQQSQSQEQEQEEQQQQQDSQQQQQQESDSSEIDPEDKGITEEQAQQLNKEDAENLLQIIENEEKKVQEKLRKISGSKKKPEKDW